MSDGSTSRTPDIRRGVVSLFLLATLVGCAGQPVATDAPAPIDSSEIDTYTFILRPSPEEAGKPAPDDGLRDAVRERVETSLADLGLTMVTRDDAAVLVAMHLGTKRALESKDPFYNFYSVEKYEEGLLVLDFIDPRSDELLWRGVSRARLRTLARGMGVNTLRFTDASEEPVWPLDAMVARLVKLSGLDDSAEERSGRLGKNARRALFRRLDQAFPPRPVEMPLDDRGGSDRK